MDLTGIRSSAFMLLYGVVWVSLIFPLYYISLAFYLRQKKLRA